MGKHFNAKHDDETWMIFFRRWHAEENGKALRREAGVSHDTWRANARRLGMRIKDLPPDHPARKRPSQYATRSDDYRHPNSALTEGQWREAMRLRALDVPDRVLSLMLGVAPSTISGQATARGLKKADLRKAAEAALEAGEAAPAELEVEGVKIDRRERAASMAAYADAIERAAGRDDHVAVARLCLAKERVDRALFGGRPGTVAASPSDGPSPLVGEEASPLELRPAQRPPEGDWTTWLFLGGRGAGKTLAGASWLADQAEALGPGGRVALIGPALHDVREVMIEGVSGIAALPRWRDGERPVFEASRRRLVFPNGVVAYAFSAEDPDSLRGPQFAAAWADEFCAWPRGRGGPGETLALLRMGLRLGTAPRLLVTTTPRPIGALKRLRLEPGFVETHAATRENADHLSPGFVAGLEALYGGTRRAAQELEGRVLDGDGALFTEAMMRAARQAAAPDGPFDRVVVAVDPTATLGGAACGIVVAGRRGERVWVLADRSASGLGPEAWARRAAEAARAFGAQAVVAEVNQGGDMVKALLKAAGCDAFVREVRASRGKRVRAEPVAALYEQGRVGHRGELRALEEELMALGGEEEAETGNDRADALVWAVTDLLIDSAGGTWLPRITAFDWPSMSDGLSAAQDAYQAMLGRGR